MKTLTVVLLVVFVECLFANCVQKGFFESTDGTTCYRLSKKPKNYTQAMVDCQGNLFAKHITVRNAFFKCYDTEAHSQDTTSIRSFPGVQYPLWIGYNKGNPTGKWRWDSPNPKPVAYTNFRPGANMTGSYAYMNSDGTWLNDFDGSLLANYICQYPNPTEPPCAATTDYTWAYYYFAQTNQCYSPVDSRDAFAGNEESCREEGGHLTRIHSQAENDFVFNTFDWEYSLQFQAWIGLKHSNGSWAWTDGTPFDPTKDYTNFFDNAIILNDGDCVSMNPYTGEWRMSDCSQKMYQACIRPALEHGAATILPKKRK